MQLWRPLLDANRPTLSSSWYFMILWTGLMSRSVICSLCPSRCFRSYRVKGHRLLERLIVKYRLAAS